MGIQRLTIRIRDVLLYILATACLVKNSVSTPEEGVALVELMSKWNVNFPSWIPGEDPCSGWLNVGCSNGRVTQLNLTEQGLSGELGSEIGQLKELTYLDVSENNLEGALPDSLEDCDNIWYLDMSDNAWNISFPEVITKLSKLEELYASNAGLQGNIPKSFFELTKLRMVYFGNNTELKADLKYFALLTNLEELTAWGMAFNSEIPDELGNLRKLHYFNCHDCLLIGGLPESFGGLKNLTEINLRQNSLTGDIPNSWKNLSEMKNLRLDSNAFLGPFPAWVFTAMPSLDHLYLSRNQFHGVPPDIASLERDLNISSKFEFLRWDCNYLGGATPCGSQNPCSNESLAKWQENNDSASFYFNPNCYSDADTDTISRVTNCARIGHTLPCQQFQTLVLQEQQCPPCPPSQKLKTGSTAANGCECGLDWSGSGSNVPVGAVVGGVLGLAFVFAVILAFILWKRRKHFSFLDIFNSKEEEGESNEWEVPPGVQRFTVEELARITSDFSDTHVIGQGGFGKVYSGTLDDGRSVAIKRASAGSVQGSREFRNEVSLLSRLHHRHLVRLEGFCAEKDFQVLVYEFMKKGNLQDNLYGSKAKLGSPLTWDKRVEIAYGIAQGLEYLHSFAHPPVIHRDVKPSNILLDDHLVAKLADFGISKESPELDTHVSTRPAGTAGYLDPDYFLRRQLTTASDVYAYGVVLLELITGQTAIDHKRHDEFNIIEWVKKRFLAAGVISIVDPRILDDYSPEAYTVMTKLALRCADFAKSGRPSMKAVLTTLEILIIPKTPTTPSNEETEWLGRRGPKLGFMEMNSESRTHTEGSLGCTPSSYI